MTDLEILITFIFRGEVIFVLYNLLCLISGFIIYCRVSNQGGGYFKRIFFTSLTLYLGPIMLLSFFTFKKKGIVDERS